MYVQQVLPEKIWLLYLSELDLFEYWESVCGGHGTCLGNNFSIVEEETIDDLDHDHGDGQLESDCSEEDVHDGDHDVDLDHDHEDGQVARMVDMQHYVRWSGGMQPSLSVTQVTIMLLLKKKKRWGKCGLLK